MKTTLSLLLASTTLCVAVGFPAMAGAPSVGGDAATCGAACAMSLADIDREARLIFVDDDGDEEDDNKFWFGGEDDEEDEDCDDDEDDDHDDDDDDDEDEGYGDGDDDDDCAGGLGSPAPAGTVAPPANGLFGTGAPPVAVTN